jgi:excisionase family DNA binding protein
MGAQKEQTWLSLGEAARRLGVHANSLRRWADNGQIAHIVTPGGHRRFAAENIHTLLEQRRQGLVPVVAGSTWMEAALTHTRHEITAHPDAAWLVPFDAEHRAEKRGLGRRLMSLLIQFVALPAESEALLGEARAIGAAYAGNARSLNMPLTTVLSAVLFFRQTVLTAALERPDDAQWRPRDQHRLISRLSRLLNEVELSVVESYESAPAG